MPASIRVVHAGVFETGEVSWPVGGLPVAQHTLRIASVHGTYTSKDE